MNDAVTIITSVTNNQIVKSFNGADYQQLKFSPGLEFLASQHPVDDLQSLASVISGLEAELTKAVIRGLPLLPENEPVARQSQNFSSISHHWCMIDIDSLHWNGDLHDHKAMRLCLESGGNSPAAFSERFDLRLIRRRGQVSLVQLVARAFPSRRPCASGFGLRRGAPKAASARLQRRAARSVF